MKINVYYQNGRLDMFDTQNYCASEPWKKEGTNIVSEFALLFDDQMLASEGLMLETFWYDATIHEDTPTSGEYQLPHAVRKAGRRIRLASQNEMQNIAKITCDGEMLVWREGDDMINGIKFFAQEILYFSYADVISINRRALMLYGYLQKAHPDKSADEVAKMIGYTKAALDRIGVEEEANETHNEEYSDDSFEGESESEEYDFG